MSPVLPLVGAVVAAPRRCASRATSHCFMRQMLDADERASPRHAVIHAATLRAARLMMAQQRASVRVLRHSAMRLSACVPCACARCRERVAAVDSRASFFTPIAAIARPHCFAEHDDAACRARYRRWLPSARQPLPRCRQHARAKSRYAPQRCLLATSA